VIPLLEKARIHAQQEKTDAALEDLGQALKMEPGNVVAMLLRAGVYQAKGDKEKALADVDQVLKLKPDLPMAIRTRAMLLADNKQFGEAAGELEKLRKLDPKDTLTMMQLGMLYMMQKKSAQAVETFTAMLAVEPDNWQALRSQGDAYLNVGKQAEAIADYEKALKIEAKDPGILNNFAWVLATSTDDKLRNGRRAILLATEACKLTEYKMPHILSTLAAAYAETGDFDSAVKWSTKAVEMNDKEHGDALKKELESYKAKKPWRELLSEEKPAEKKQPNK
jgi:Flp pilus assembly protein TadD